MNEVRFERFVPGEHLPLVEPLTEILHASYAPLAARGMRYMATHQPPERTLERLSEGESHLVFRGVELIGTVTLYGERPASTCEHYRKPGVFSFGQFAIRPDLQGQGIGSRLMAFLEERALALGAVELALDTSERADHLISMYARRGYRHVGFAQWNAVNYRSVILSKRLVAEA